ARGGRRWARASPRAATRHCRARSRSAPGHRPSGTRRDPGWVKGRRMTVRTRRRAALAVGLLLVLCAGRAHAIVGHYTAGFPNVHDYFMPPAGLYYAQYFYFYNTDTFKDRNGDSIDSVTIRRGPAAGTVRDLDLNVNQYVIAPAILWSPDWSWHGIRYGAYGMVPLANANIS